MDGVESALSLVLHHLIVFLLTLNPHPAAFSGRLPRSIHPLASASFSTRSPTADESSPPKTDIITLG